MKREHIVNQIKEILHRVAPTAKTGVIISPMVTLKKLWDSRPFKTPFYINVMNEGVVL